MTDKKVMLYALARLHANARGYISVSSEIITALEKNIAATEVMKLPGQCTDQTEEIAQLKQSLGQASVAVLNQEKEIQRLQVLLQQAYERVYT